MGSLILYGSPRSRTMRVLWMVEELGLEFEHIPYEFDDPALNADAFLQLNRSGAVPTLVDDGHALSESLAINLYLAKTYSEADTTSLYAQSPHEEASMWQWSLWVQGHLEPWIQKDVYLVSVTAALVGLQASIVERALSVLDSTLDVDTWLVGDRFTVADLNVAGVLSPSRSSGLELDPFPNIARWLARCYQRPAAVSVRKRFFADDST